MIYFRYQNDNKQMKMKLDQFCQTLQQLDISLLNIQMATLEAETNWYNRLESAKTEQEKVY